MRAGQRQHHGVADRSGGVQAFFGGRITAVVPYFGYARQDRKVKPRTPITAKLVADLMQAAGIERVLTMDLHAGQIQGFFDIPVDNLYAEPPLIVHAREHLVTPDPADTVIVSPDAGGVERARSYAMHLGCGLAIIDKRRDRPNESAVMHIVGDVKGKRAVLVDDMIDTAGTLTKGAAAVKAAGANEVHALATHPVLWAGVGADTVLRVRIGERHRYHSTWRCLVGH